MKKKSERAVPALRSGSPALSPDALLEQVRALVQSARRAAAATIDTFQAVTNYQIGRLIVEHEQQGTRRAEYGEQVLKELAERLTAEFGRGFFRSSLEYMRRFFLVYRDRFGSITQTPSGKLPEAGKTQTPSGKTVIDRISATPSRKSLPIAAIGQTAINDSSPISQTLSGKFTLSWSHYVYFVDLVFYNRLLRAYVLLDLKIGKLTHQDLGQMQMYVNHFDRCIKRDDEHPTVGIILCKKKHDALVKLTLPKEANIFASQYELYLPSKEDLRQRLMQWTAEEEGRA